MSNNDESHQNLKPTGSHIIYRWMSADTKTLSNYSGHLAEDDKPEVNHLQLANPQIINQSAAASARLLIERGRSAGKQFLLNNREIQIGRWDADNGVFPDIDLDADDPEAKVSRRHARIVRSGNEYLIEDLGSTNGTFINRGRRLLPGNQQTLNDNDEIIVGKTFLRFQIIREDEQLKLKI